MVDVDLLVRADVDVVVRNRVEDEDSRSLLAEDAPILRQVRSERVETFVKIPRGAENRARDFAICTSSPSRTFESRRSSGSQMCETRPRPHRSRLTIGSGYVVKVHGICPAWCAL